MQRGIYIVASISYLCYENGKHVRFLWRYRVNSYFRLRIASNRISLLMAVVITGHAHYHTLAQVRAKEPTYTCRPWTPLVRHYRIATLNQVRKA